MTVRYGAHCPECPDPATFTNITERDRWVTGHPHRVVTSTEYRP